MKTKASNPSSRPAFVLLLSDVKHLVIVNLLIGVFLGIILGFSDVFQNEYLKYAYYYLAIDNLNDFLNRYVYVVAFFTIGFAILLGLIKLFGKKVLIMIFLGLAVLLVSYITIKFDVDHRLDLHWRDLNLTTKLLVFGVFFTSMDMILGKKWLKVLAGGFAPKLFWGAVVILIVANASSFFWFKSLQKQLANKPNIMIIGVDALRADHVGIMGYHRPTTPTIDSLARQSAYFTRAFSNSNYTRGTLPAIFTMSFPSVHGIVEHVDVLSDKFFTLAELLKDAGYATLAYIPNPNMKKRYNVNQGFDVYDDQILYQRYLGISKTERYETASKINRKVIKWVENNPGKKFFLFMHYTDVHAPYLPPPSYKTMFYKEQPQLRPEQRISKAAYDKMNSYMRLSNDNDDLNYYLAQYDAEIRYTDDQLQKLLTKLRELGVLDNTIIFLTADHGEAFFEHGEWEHGGTLHDEMTHVPLIAHFPGGKFRGKKIEVPVLTFDISATILDELKITPPTPIQARSFLPLLTGESSRVWEFAYIENIDKKMRALRNEEWKFIQDDAALTEELYHLREDPQEKNNLVSERKDQVALFREKLNTIKKYNDLLSRGRKVQKRDLDEETLEQLRSLGYIK